MNDTLLWAETGRSERRQDHRLRLAFDTAFSMIEPFLDADAGWPTHSLSHLSFRILRDNFTELSRAELHALVVALHRAYIERNPQRSDHLVRPDELHPPVCYFPA